MSVTETVLPPPPEEEEGLRPAPSNLAAEQAVLGSMMLSRTAIQDAMGTLDASDFYRPHHELIYSAMLEMEAQEKPIDAITVGDELAERGVLKRCGGYAYLHQMIDAVPTAQNAGYYADIVRETAVLRRLVEAGTRITQLGYNQGGGPLDDIVNAAERELEAVAILRDKGNPRSHHPWEVHDLRQVVQDGDITQETAVLKRADGFALLYPGSFHSMAAEPESGKSWTALIACAQELSAGEWVTYVDWEDRPGRIVSRLQLLGVDDEAIVKRFRYIRPVAPIDQIGHTLLDHAAVSSTLVVLDGITEAMTLQGLDLNSQNDVAHFIHAFPKRLADLGPAVLQIDHLPKQTEDGNRFAIGAQHKLAGLDGAAYLLKVIDPFGRGKIGKARITVAKDREGFVREQAVGHHIGDLILESHGEQLMAYIQPPKVATHSTDGTFRPTVLMERVSRFVEENPETSGNTISTTVKGKRSGILDAVKVLHLEGYLTTVNGPRGSVLYKSATAYREATDAMVKGQSDDWTPPEGF